MFWDTTSRSRQSVYDSASDFIFCLHRALGAATHERLRPSQVFSERAYNFVHESNLPDPQEHYRAFQNLLWLSHFPYLLPFYVPSQAYLSVMLNNHYWFFFFLTNALEIGVFILQQVSWVRSNNNILNWAFPQAVRKVKRWQCFLGRTFCWKYLTWKLSQTSLLAVFLKFIFALFYKVCGLTFSEKAAFEGVIRNILYLQHSKAIIVAGFSYSLIIASSFISY